MFQEQRGHQAARPAALLSTGVTDFRLPGGEAIVFDSGVGPYVWDTMGRRYIDYVLGFGPVVLGHCHPRFVELMAGFGQLPLHYPGYGRVHHDYAAALGAKLGLTGGVALYKQSSDSVTAGIRLANAITGRRGIIRAGFMGWHDIQLAGSPSWHEPLESPFRRRTKTHRAFYPLHPDDRLYDWTSLDLADLASELQSRPAAHSAFVIDIVQLAYAPADQVKKAVSILREHGVQVIYDETKTGGRQDCQCAYKALGLPEPDMIVLGKAIGNGAPLSVLAVTANKADLFAEIRAGGTHSKETSAVYAGLVTLRCMAELGGYEFLVRNAQDTSAAFNAGFAQGGIGQLVATEVFADGLIMPRLSGDLLSTPRLREALQRQLAHEGILLRLGHPVFVSVSHAEVVSVEVSRSIAKASASFATQYLGD